MTFHKHAHRAAPFIFLLSLMSFSVLAQQSNAELETLYHADQRERKTNTPGLDKNDAARRTRVKQILLENNNLIGIDLFHAAMVFQHGNLPEDYKMAHELVKRALSQGYRESDALILFAQSKDRWLRSQNKKQIYGTQMREIGRSEFKYLQLTDTTVISNKQRNELKLGSWEELLQSLNARNHVSYKSLQEHMIDEEQEAALLAKAKNESPILIGDWNELLQSVETPAQALQNGIKGKVVVEFTINENGVVEKATVTEGLGYGCDEAALTFIKSLRYKNHSGRAWDRRTRIPFG